MNENSLICKIPYKLIYKKLFALGLTIFPYFLSFWKKNDRLTAVILFLMIYCHREQSRSV